MATSMNTLSEHPTNTLHNWVTAVKTLDCLKCGMKQFIKEEATNQYDKNVTTVSQQAGSYSCTVCSLENILPDHAVNNTHCKLNNRANCHCKQNGQRRLCPQNACGRFHDLICDQHTQQKPNWSNTNPVKWSTSCMEYIKCCIPTNGYKPKHSFDELDASALLSICQNNAPLHTHFQQPRHPGVNYNGKNLMSCVFYEFIAKMLCYHYGIIISFYRMVIDV